MIPENAARFTSPHSNSGPPQAEWEPTARVGQLTPLTPHNSEVSLGWP